MFLGWATFLMFSVPFGNTGGFSTALCYSFSQCSMFGAVYFSMCLMYLFVYLSVCLVTGLCSIHRNEHPLMNN